jgi:hypothetical protein
VLRVSEVEEAEVQLAGGRSGRGYVRLLGDRCLAGDELRSRLSLSGMKSDYGR